MLKHPHIRFKTIAEMIADYGTNWMDGISAIIGPQDALNTMSYFQGKTLYNSLVHPTTWRTHFAYGPTSLPVSMKMLTTRQRPKYDMRGQILKPGMIVRVEYLAVGPAEKSLVSNNLRNTPGTLVRVLKVFNPVDYVDASRLTSDWPKIDSVLIATELREPFSGVSLDDVKMMYGRIFKSAQINAFEIAHRVSHTTEPERAFYYKTIK